MSAIYGIIDFSKKTIDKKLINQMQSCYSMYKIDKYDSICKNNLSLGCGHQFITKESFYEINPYYDSQNQIYLTADCYLDNRSELIQLLALSQYTPDVLIIYSAYLKWDTDCVKHLDGCFSFVIYNENKNTAYLFTDITASRCLYYYYANYKLYFSTTITPILKITQSQIKLNKQWLIKCAAIKGPIMFTNPAETAFKNVYKLECGTYTQVTKKRIKTVRYYNPLRSVKKLKDNKLHNLDKTLIPLLSKTVSNQSLTNGNVGIFLSSGLDSSAIACVAAPLLEKEGKSLYSYTATPDPNFNSDFSTYYVTDETKGVLELCSLYKNIKPYFDCYKGRSILKDTELLLRYFELPTKSNQNSVWLDELSKKASMDGCKILLTGQSGNATVSHGTYSEYLYDLFSHLKVNSLFNEMNFLKTTYHKSRKKIVKNCISGLLSNLTQVPYGLLCNYLEDTCISLPRFEKLQLKIDLIKVGILSGPKSILSSRKLRSNMYLPIFFSQANEVYTKVGLKYGLLIRDTYSSKQMLEYCMSLPMSYFVSNGTERRLIRNTFKELLPKELLMPNKRGLQSADRYERFQKEDLPIFKDFIHTLEKYKSDYFINYPQLSCWIDSLKKDRTVLKNETQDYIINLYVLKKFISLYDQ